MEQRFGHDFSRVRVHTDSTAASSATHASAQAYTIGNDVVFGSGQYNPGSPAGRQLLAHELAHVVQQDTPGGGAAPANAYESEAGAAAERVSRGEPASVTLAAPTAMQRQPLPGSSLSADLTETASPLMAAAIGSTTLDGFETGKADISAGNRKKLERTVDTIVKLLKPYPASTIRVIGYTDAVGQESDNLALGQARADSVQSALLDMGIPGVSVQTESRGATEFVVNSKKSEGRNRRVEVRFQPTRLMHTGLSGGLTFAPSPTPTPPTPPPSGATKGIVPGIGDLCLTNPTLCYGTDPGKPTVPPGALQPIPDDTPWELMDVGGINENYTSHGVSPREAGDLRAKWAEAYWRYFHAGKSKEIAAKLANSEISGTAGKGMSRDYPNPADQLDRDMQKGYPDAKKIGPVSIPIYKF